VKILASPLQLLKERYFGETRNPWVAENELKRLSQQLPAEVVPVVSDAVHSLIDYQDPDYALLYLDRLTRFIGTAGISPAMFGDIARLLAARMLYEDPIRIAQMTLAEASVRVEKFRWDEVVAMMPPSVSGLVSDLLTRLRLARRTVTLHFSAASRLSLFRLKGWIMLRLMRRHSQRYVKEKNWVERWLHMIERSLAKCHEATSEVIQTAALIKGHGDGYQDAIANWSIIIDGLVKPSCDGTLRLSNLADAIARSREAAQSGGRERVLQIVEESRLQAKW
jgi:hypothetical protein